MTLLTYEEAVVLQKLGAQIDCEHVSIPTSARSWTREWFPLEHLEDPEIWVWRLADVS